MYKIFVLFIAVVFSIILYSEEKTKDLDPFIVNATRVELPANYYSPQGMEKVTFSAYIDTLGIADSVQVISGNKMLIPLAREEIKSWMFSPKVVDNVAIPSYLEFSVYFYKKEYEALSDSVDISKDKVYEALQKEHKKQQSKKTYFSNNLSYYLENNHFYTLETTHDYAQYNGFSILPNPLRNAFQLFTLQQVTDFQENAIIPQFMHQFYHLPITYIDTKSGLAPNNMNEFYVLYQKGDFANIKNLDFAAKFFSQDGEWITTNDTASDFSFHSEYRSIFGKFQMHYVSQQRDFTSANLSQRFLTEDIYENPNYNDVYPNGEASIEQRSFSLLYESRLFSCGYKSGKEAIEQSKNFESESILNRTTTQYYIGKKMSVNAFLFEPKVEHFQNVNDDGKQWSPSFEMAFQGNRIIASSLLKKGYPYDHYLNFKTQFKIAKKETDIKKNRIGFNVKILKNDDEYLFYKTKNETLYGITNDYLGNYFSISNEFGKTNMMDKKQYFYCFNSATIKMTTNLQNHTLNWTLKSKTEFRNVEQKTYPKMMNKSVLKLDIPLHFNNRIFGEFGTFYYDEFESNDMKINPSLVLEGNFGFQISEWFKIWIEFKNIGNRSYILDQKSIKVPYGFVDMNNHQHSNVRFEWTFIN